jgi:hypothetical protein
MEAVMSVLETVMLVFMVAVLGMGVANVIHVAVWGGEFMYMPQSKRGRVWMGVLQCVPLLGVLAAWAVRVTWGENIAFLPAVVFLGYSIWARERFATGVWVAPPRGRYGDPLKKRRSWNVTAVAGMVVGLVVVPVAGMGMGVFLLLAAVMGHWRDAGIAETFGAVAVAMPAVATAMLAATAFFNRDGRMRGGEVVLTGMALGVSVAALGVATAVGTAVSMAVTAG